ncbi:MAG TPA: cupredoxin domain-containing protein [Candidatus Nanoarchaeia archaeon]|nr:cupredoxin domain-containing protein [Candidatus Nanoarchaeia archaeon]
MDRKSLVIGVAVLALIGAFVVLKPKPKTQTTPQQTVQQKTFTLEIKDKKLISGPETIQVNQGDEVTIKITLDATDEVHLHGYDKSVELEPNQPGEIKFTADTSGRFPFELEGSKTELGAVEVAPK